MLSAGASSSSSFPLDKYEVFLSFRGSDTRHNFTSHLHAALSRKKIKTFIDDEFERGDQISPTLFNAIDESKISVIIFSKKYASSSWCLKELAYIHNRMEYAGQIVVPVFYHVDPSDVRKQHGVFTAAFAELEERFKNEKDKVQKWRLAMTAIANLSGWDSCVIRHESQLVETIVEDILKKLKRISCGVDLNGIFGIEKRIESMELLLRIDVHDVRIIGIWGMGGIGKTTVANFVFTRLSFKFDSCCFLENVREKWKKGRKKLQNKICRALLEEENLNKDTLLIRSDYVQGMLRRKRILLVLDNVDDREQLALLSDYDLFGPGSRIIITTRDVQLLNNLADDTYKVERLNIDEALQLFHFHAFKRSSLTKDPYTKLSRRAVNCAAGNPLALKVLGSHFGNKNKEKWERALNELKKFPYNEQVHNVLMTSYDGLDEGQKSMFLDIACFFKGKTKDYVERILSCCDIFGDAEIDDLIDKSLITITGNNKIEMHDMIQEMGWEIIRQQCKNKPGKRSRLWNAQDIYHVLKNNKATAAIEGICLDVSDIGDVHLSPFVFEKMANLRLLWIFNSKITKKGTVCFDEDLQTLPGNLNYLHWEEYPLKSLPTNFTAEKLVELSMPHSQLESLWIGVQCLENLKKIDLSYSKRLIEVPDLSRARKLETIYLEECESLCQVPTYFENLDQLITLFLVGCSSLSEFPQVPKNIRCLVLCRTAIARVPPSIESLSYLEILCLRYCTRLESLPHISKPKRLKAIELEGTVFEKELPHWIYDVIEERQPTAQHNFSSFWRGWKTNNYSGPNFLALSKKMYSFFLGQVHIMACQWPEDSVKQILKVESFGWGDKFDVVYNPYRPIIYQFLEYFIDTKLHDKRSISKACTNLSKGDFKVQEPWYESYGSLINIMLPLDALNTKFLGFKLRAVVLAKGDDTHAGRKPKVRCQPIYITMNQMPCQDYRDIRHNILVIKFEFTLENNYDKPDLWYYVNSCGVQFVYEGDFLDPKDATRISLPGRTSFTADGFDSKGKNEWTEEEKNWRHDNYSRQCEVAREYDDDLRRKYDDYDDYLRRRKYDDYLRQCEVARKYDDFLRRKYDDYLRQCEVARKQKIDSE